MEVPVLISSIPFKDISVPVYYNKYTPNPIWVWKHRNEEAFYFGLIYVNVETGKCSYPDGIITPTEPSKEDAEWLPKFICVGVESLDEQTLETINNCLETEYKIRNK